MALAHEQKAQAVGWKILSSHIRHMLPQAQVLKKDTLYCFVVINLIEAPRTVEVNLQIETLTMLVWAIEKSAVTTAQGVNSLFGSWCETQAVIRQAEEMKQKSCRAMRMATRARRNINLRYD